MWKACPKQRGGRGDRREEMGGGDGRSGEAGLRAPQQRNISWRWRARLEVKNIRMPCLYPRLSDLRGARPTADSSLDSEKQRKWGHTKNHRRAASVGWGIGVGCREAVGVCPDAPLGSTLALLVTVTTRISYTQLPKENPVFPVMSGKIELPQHWYKTVVRKTLWEKTAKFNIR